jgi:hypothetical protein
MLNWNKRTKILLCAALLALAAAGGAAWYMATPRGYVRSAFAAAPLPPGSREVGRELRDWAEGPACPYAQLLAAYETEQSWEEVAGFYQEQLQRSGWSAVERRVLGRDAAANIDLEQIEADWPLNSAKPSELTLTIVNFSQLMDAPPSTARTLFTVGVEYIPDVEFFRSSALCQD